jgi:hypothetical protein
MLSTVILGNLLSFLRSVVEISKSGRIILQRRNPKTKITESATII